MRVGGSGWRKCVARWSLSLAKTLFSYKTENASECCEWRSVPVSGRDMRIRHNVVKRSRIVSTVLKCSKIF